MISVNKHRQYNNQNNADAHYGKTGAFNGGNKGAYTPETGESCHKAALKNFNSGEYRMAIVECDKALNLADSSNKDIDKDLRVRAWCLRGLANKKLGNKEEAFDDFGKVLDLKPDHASATAEMKKILAEA